MIKVQTEDVDIGALTAAAKVPGTGAVVLFDGVVRDDDITEMELEAYEDVAVAEMEKIAADATRLHRLLHVDIIHRIGRLSVGENILIILVSAGHRPEAYAGSRYIIEEIKKSVPIWKKELTKNGGRWVPGEHGHGRGKPGSPS
ncbi:MULTISPECIES: molybdenum cofactor biosynthesis protein MoaE [unclassified Methanoregula]|uniref:molybdenum cofactor biosynthesis protein MoaE n=1 Tax=unclassified Methanoregula TaxID=2649730 RepID=UPI0009CD9FF6|nr:MULTISPECIES: molybdenum cofactor biosynthesis protein MoaE [unclassified Methanoregula]OPX62644.1 MAG: molybdopterin guanine dinucleotide biosynthesis protein MoaE [Methanoregula sp. PtaB.Bin085]OPY33019.1 MAG: molybdopterin guanine dinucleotide biosynthesis protein MoaE [Methanoregula sp. PtaU1.Bin006]